jgi:hypothetical protein
MKYCPIPQLFEVVSNWDNYYPKPFEVDRMGVTLSNPGLTISSRSAKHHDFYYFSDEFSVIFNPLKFNNNVFLLVEGPHKDPMSGVRVPLLSTWSHLKRIQHGESGFQENFAFFDNKWWNANFHYDYNSNWISNCPYNPLFWCGCEGGYSFVTHKLINGHRIRQEVYNNYTIKDNNINDEVFQEIVKDFLKHKNIVNLNIVGDYLLDQNDLFGHYIQNICRRSFLNTYRNRELRHICKFLEHNNNKRSWMMIILAYTVILFD